ncbi:hypothetical protein AB4308_02455, partial [Vibrio breoganii]
SYGFLQTLPLANNALASRVIFPSVGVIQVSLNLTGLPASLGKQKKADRFPYRLFTIYNLLSYSAFINYAIASQSCSSTRVSIER